MKHRLGPALLCLLLSAALNVLNASESPASGSSIPASTDAQPELVVVVVDVLRQQNGVYGDFNRIAYEFGSVFEKRKWPVRIRFASFANEPEPHPLELRIFYRGIFNDLGHSKFRAWMTLTAAGKHAELGWVEHRYAPRMWENNDDIIGNLFRGTATETANLIEPLLFKRVRVPKS